MEKINRYIVINGLTLPFIGLCLYTFQYNRFILLENFPFNLIKFIFYYLIFFSVQNLIVLMPLLLLNKMYKNSWVLLIPLIPTYAIMLYNFSIYKLNGKNATIGLLLLPLSSIFFLIIFGNQNTYRDES